MHLSHAHWYQQLILCRCLVQGVRKGDRVEGKISYLWKNTKENIKMARKNSVNILALNSNKATHCWRTGWRMTDGNAASNTILPCLSKGWAGGVLHEQNQQNTHTESLSPAQSSEVTVSKVLSISGFIWLKVESHDLTQQLWLPVYEDADENSPGLWECDQCGFSWASRAMGRKRLLYFGMIGKAVLQIWFC